LNIGTNTATAGYRLKVNGGAILSTNTTTGGAIVQGNASTPYIALGTFADPINYLQIQSSGGVNNINTKSRNLRIFSTAATTGITFNQSNGEVYNGSTSDFGAFLFQNTGGLYQNGNFSLNGTESGLATDSILVKGTDSIVRQIAAASFTTPAQVSQQVQDSTGYYNVSAVTTDDAFLTVANVPITSGQAYSVHMEAVAISEDGDSSCAFIKQRLIMRNSAGTMSTGTLRDIVPDEYLGGFDSAIINIVQSGGGDAILLDIKGQTGVTMRWSVRYKLLPVDALL
jgi:hypothetical protein